MSKTLNENKYIIELDEFPDYFISSEGDLFSDKFGKMKKLKLKKNNSGYYYVTLCKNGKKYYKTVHRLVADTFIANPNKLEQVDHINHNPLDNRIENLRWVSRQDNHRNRSISKANISEYQGVCFHKKRNRWSAQWNDDNKKFCIKYFPVKQYGDEAKQMAIDYREKIVDKLYNRV